MFVGAHERQLDDKGRVALPATYRTHLGEHCYLVKGTDKCVEVVPSEAFEQFGRELIAKVERGDLTLNRQRAIASSAVLVGARQAGTHQRRRKAPRVRRSLPGEPGRGRRQPDPARDLVTGALRPNRRRRHRRHRRRPGVNGSNETPRSTVTATRQLGSEHSQKGARQRIDRRNGSSDPFAHLQSSGLQDGQPLLRPLPSRLTGETSRRHRPAGGLQMSERHCDGVR